VTEKSKLYVGIDPGIKNLGMSVLTLGTQEKLHIQHSFTRDVSVEEIVREALAFPLEVFKYTPDVPSMCSLEGVCIERYVPYDGRHSAVSEDITQLIGMLRVAFNLQYPDSPILLFRAIEWKVSLAQVLAKYEAFQNPSKDLDKKFSFAAARHLVDNPEVIKTSHEADSICLAAIPHLIRKYRHGQNLPEKSSG
jgi:hypothetical protein